MARRTARVRSHASKQNTNQSFVKHITNALSEQFSAFRSCRFEDLEPRHLMTTVGWEIPQFEPILEQHSTLDLQPRVELHAPFDPIDAAGRTIQHHSTLENALSQSQPESDQESSCSHAHGYINLQDYDGNLLANWQELVAAEEHEHQQTHDHGSDSCSCSNCCPCSCSYCVSSNESEMDSGSIPIEEQYTLWGNKWAQSGGLGSPVTITYSYSNLLDGGLLGITTTQLKAGVEKALQLWSTYAPLNFVEVVDSGPSAGDTGYTAGTTPNIRIGHHFMDGASQVLAHAYYPQSSGLAGDVHFDSGDTWKIGTGQGGIDFVEVTLHEIGHSLGLQHESTNPAIMNPYYGGRFANLNSAYLLQDDINGIRAIYGTGTGSVSPLVVNHTPVLAAIADVSLPRSQNTIDVTLNATDSDGDPITFTATASQQNAVDLLAYNLDQQYGFSLNSTDYYNYRGAGEKYFVGSGGQFYFILPNGSVYSWNSTIENSTQIGTLDSSYHANLSKLCSAQLPATTPVNAGLSFSGNTLTIDPASNFTGTFQVNVSASDGNTSASRTFNVTVTNQTPTLAAIADQFMNPSHDSIAVSLSYSDPDGDALTVTGSVIQADPVKATAYTLDQNNQFTAEVTQYYNYRGAGEKYFQNASGSWYFILANGQVYSWGGSIAGSTLLATLDSRFHSDLSLLYNAQPESGAPNGVVLSVSGNTLTVNPPNGFTGSFAVTVTVSDGAASAQRTFQLDIANHAPTLNAIADQTLSPSTGSKTIVISATDVDGDSLSFSATALQVDAMAQQAYDLDQQRGFQSAGNDYYNYRGAGEKYFVDRTSNFHFILPNGEVYSWGGSIAGSTRLATLNSTYHSNLSLLYNAQAPTGQAINAGLTWNGNSLTISPPNGFTGSFAVTVTVSDGSASAQRTFQVDVANHNPTLNAIADLSLSPGTPSSTIVVAATDVDGDSLSFSATAVQVDAVAQQAYDLDQQRGFQSAGNDYYNHRGAGERYFIDSASSFYFILPNGEVYSWGGSIAGSTRLATLNSTYHSNLSLLYNAQAPTGQAINAGLTWNGNSLTVSPPNGFTGSFQVTVTASDGSLTASRSFNVSVVNHVPQIASIANQAMSPHADSIQVALSVSDADGDSLTYALSATQVDAVSQAAYDLDQQYNFQAGPSDYFNHRGANEKYFQDASGNWYFILPNASVYRWTTSIQGSTLLGQLDASYYANVTKLYNVAVPSGTPVNVVLQVNNGQLTIDPPANFSGRFQVTVAVSDGQATSETSFEVNVANQAPTLAAIADQTMTSNQNSIQVAFTAADADGDSLTVTATAAQIDATAQRAYNLDQQHGFYPGGTDYYNFRGVGEKYFQGTGGAWFYILPNGQVYQWGGTIADSTLLATLNSSYHSNLNLLVQAQQPTTNPVNVALSVSNGVLTIDPANGFSGQFDVTLSASDGVASTSRTFSVTVSANLSDSTSSGEFIAANPGWSDPIVLAIPSPVSRVEPLQKVISESWQANGHHRKLPDHFLSNHHSTAATKAVADEAFDGTFTFFNRHSRNEEDDAAADESNEFFKETEEEAALDLIFSAWADMIA